MNNNLARFERNNLELLIDTQTGEVFASQTAIARMCGVESTTVRRFFSSGKKTAKLLPVIDSRGVIQQTKLFPEQLIKECLAKFSPELLLQCVDAGLRVYLHKLAGFEVKSTAVEHQIPQTYAEALLEAGRLALEVEKLKSQNEQLELRATEDKPKVEFANAIAFSDDSVSIGEFAKMIGTGRNRLFNLLREMGVIMKGSTIAYQKHCDAGYFEVSQEILGNGKIIPFSLLTGKGQVWLYAKIQRRKVIQEKAVSAIAKGVKMDLSL